MECVSLQVSHISVQKDIYRTIAPIAAARMATMPTLEAGVLAALPVGVELAAEVELAALDMADVEVVIETTGEEVGAAVIKLPLV
jgi:hypothetical protein